MSALALVTPVHGRFELTRIVLEQRSRLLDELASLGVDAYQVIVGDDANLDTAREFDFEILECPNVLGLRINDGFEYAFRELVADHVCYVGSDDWLLPAHLADVPTQGRARASRWISLVSPDGKLIAAAEGSPAKGRVPWTLSRDLLAPSGFRPADDTLTRFLDTSILRGLPLPTVEAFEFHAEDDPLRCVDFKSNGVQMTPWRLHLPGPARPNPFEVLATRYPADLCERMEEFYAT